MTEEVEETLPDLQPRFEDIELMKEALETPWKIPQMSLAYSQKHGSGAPVPPFDLMKHPVKESTTRKRWQALRKLRSSGQDAKMPMAEMFGGDSPHYTSPIEMPLMELLAPQPGQTRSVIFIHHSYYHFYYLAQALRRRGWNAWSLSSEDPSLPNNNFYHGQDLNIWHPDPVTRLELRRELYATIIQHFDMVHFHGDAFFSLFDETMCNTYERDGIGWDFLELKSLGVKIGHSMSGCLTGQRKTLFNEVTGVCDKCVWQNVPNVCSDNAQYHSGRRIELVCDLNALEVDWPIDFSRHTKNCFYDPLTYCYSEDLWRPNIAIPDRIEKFKRKPGEVLVFHAVGNLKDRQSTTRNIKGTPAVLDAIDRLQAEGYPVKLVFKTGVPSRDMRYYQSQADIIVDQLNYGRWGATARETMALGIPTICRMKREQPCGVKPSRAVNECPLVDASEDTVYEVLKDLIENPDKRKRIGRESLAFAKKWHSADACAERFERVYDRLQAGQFPLDVDEIYA